MVSIVVLRGVGEDGLVTSVVLGLSDDDVDEVVGVGDVTTVVLGTGLGNMVGGRVVAAAKGQESKDKT